MKLSESIIVLSTFYFQEKLNTLKMYNECLLQTQFYIGYWLPMTPFLNKRQIHKVILMF